jgi:tetratricopeptide (TPR) repeat protein
MSVLYKALQKAAKDNEQRQAPPPGFDAERLAGSGVIRSSGSRGRMNWRIIGFAMTLVFVAAMGVAYYLTTPPSPAPQLPTVALAPPAHPTQQTPAPAAATTPAPAAGVVAAVTPAPAAAPVSQPAAARPAAGAPAPAAQQVAEAATEPAEKQAPAAQQVAEAAKEQAPAPKAQPSSTIPKPMSREPMPEIDANSPARMLSPPISVRRVEADLGGVGNAVQVRQIAKEAQNDVGAGYAALLRGDYDTALGFYNSALKQEPTSVLAALGRGDALQKLGRVDEAREAYETVLKTDPQNREALTNLTGILAEKQPGEALARLLDLSKEYPAFSPITAQIGMTYAKMDNLSAAVEFLRRAVDMTPDAVMYNYDLAVVLDRMHLGDQAAASYRQVLSLMDVRKTPELSKADIERRLAYLTVK